MTSSYSFNCVCYSLAAIFILLGILSLLQFLRLHFRDEGSVLRFVNPYLHSLSTLSLYCITVCYNSVHCFWPATVQQQVHLIIFFLCSIRAAFFFVAIDAWNPDTGEVENNKEAFYSLDEFAVVLFFTLTSALALFWAELYYISIEKSDTFVNYVRPITYAINFAALLGAGMLSYYVSVSYTEDVDYVFFQYTILVATVYFISAIMFAYYASAAASELKQAPVQLSARQNRLGLLRLLGGICISALIIKACILIYYTGKSIETTSDGALSSVFFYYFFLELVPIFIVLIYYRVQPQDYDFDDGEDYENDVSESTPLDPSATRTPRTSSPIRHTFTKYVDYSAPKSMVDKVLALEFDTFIF